MIKIIKGLISQSGENPPTMVVFENSLGFLPEWRYNDPGSFEISNFTFNKARTWFYLSTWANNGFPFDPSAGLYCDAGGLMRLFTTEGGAVAYANGVLDNTPFVIEIHEHEIL